MKTIAIYARVSSDQQAQQETIESQIAETRRKAEGDGHRVLPDMVFADDGFSGASLIRPALEELRDRVANGEVELVYVHSPDRLARRYAYQVLLLDEFRSRDVKVVFVHGGSEETAEESLLVQVQGVIAEYERAKILERCRRGKLHRARSGLVNPLSGAPYGYLYVKKVETEPARYEVLLHEAKMVRRMFHEYAQEHKSLAEIVRRLNHDQIPTRRGVARWDRSTVWGVLRNPAYKGEAAYGKTEAVERGAVLRPIRGRNLIPRRAKSTHRDRPREEWIHLPVPPIVSEEIFDLAAEQLERNRRRTQGTRRGRRYLLQGLTVCANCGYAFYGKPVSRSSARGRVLYEYYRCTGTDGYRFAGGRICHNSQVRVDQLDGFVWESVQALMQEPERVAAEWEHRASTDRQLSQLRTERDEASKALDATDKSIQRLLDAYESGALELEELTKRTTRLKNRKQRSEASLKAAEQRLSSANTLRAVVTRVETCWGPRGSEDSRSELNS